MANLTDGRASVDVSTNKTLAAADSGIVQNVVADGITITLPATTAAGNFIIRNGGLKPSGAANGAVSSGTVLVTVAPNAADGITGNGFTATVNKAALNTKATSMVGDELRLRGTGTTGVTGWVVESAIGTWARQA
jgi:hypothetical protein